AANRVSFRAQVESPAGAFVVASLVEDGGWSARDERGSWIPTSLANGPFLALRLPNGDHRLSVTYLPPGFSLGLPISHRTAVLVGGALALKAILPESGGPAAAAAAA